MRTSHTRKAATAALLLVPLLTGCSSGGTGAPLSASPSARGEFRFDRPKAEQALPGPGNVPAGWKVTGRPEPRGKGSPPNVFVRTSFSAPDLRGFVGFTVAGFKDVEAARARYAAWVAEYGTANGNMGPIASADEDYSRAGCLSGNCSTTVILRVGKAVATAPPQPRDRCSARTRGFERQEALGAARAPVANR